MSKWIRGIYNSAANFVLSGSLRAASGSSMGRNNEHMRKKHVKCDQSSESGKSCQSDNAGTATASTTRTSTCSAGNACSRSGRTSTGSSASSTCSTCSNDILHTSDELCDNKCEKCHPTFCDHIERDYADYISATGAGTVRTEGQGAGSRIRFSIEPGYYQQSHSISTDPVEYITGIQSGVTV